MADALSPVLEALRRRKDLLGWTARHRFVRGEQLFAGNNSLDARRAAEREEVRIEVLCASDGAADPPMCGAASVRISPGDPPAAAIEFAVQAARRTRNPLYPLPEPSPLPDTPLVDPRIESDPAAVVEGLHERLQAASASDARARLTLAEWFADHEQVHLVNSVGIDVKQAATELSLEWILLAGDGDERVETVLDLSRRRVADLDVEGEWSDAARQTADRGRASQAEAYDGPVVLRDKAVAAFINGGVFQTLASARARFANISHWEIGRPVAKEATRGDPLTLWANRSLPFGNNASRFDGEGIPGQRVSVIQDGTLLAYAASQRYATYLDLPATGDFGDPEMPPGPSAAQELIEGPHIEVTSWSWFSPNPTTGDFASEIRLGYVVDGERRPFTGGLLVGNVLEALGDVRWSRETAFLGDYQGPTTARFARLKVVPSRE